MNVRNLRHQLTKSAVVRAPLAWLYHRGLHATDVFIASYPRAGSTWLRFLLYELLTGEEGDFPAVNRAIPGVGRHRAAPPLLSGSRRLLQTHEPYRREYRRAVYLVRDVRDVVVSEFYFQRMWGIFAGDFESFVPAFLRGEVNRYGSWQAHTRAWLDAQAQRPNDILLVKFGELRRAPEATVAQILAFVGEERADDVIAAAVAHNSKERMREKEDVFNVADKNLSFVRKGAVGGWRATLTEAQVAAVEAHAGAELERLGYVRHAVQAR